MRTPTGTNTTLDDERIGGVAKVPVLADRDERCITPQHLHHDSRDHRADEGREAEKSGNQSDDDPEHEDQNDDDERRQKPALRDRERLGDCPAAGPLADHGRRKDVKQKDRARDQREKEGRHG